MQICDIQIKYLYLLFGLFVAFYSCQSSHNNPDNLAFKPALHQDYSYALIQLSTQQWTYNTVNDIIYDTVKINFTIQNSKNGDSMNICKLTFNDFEVKMHPVKVTFIGADIGESLLSRNPFVILDSIGYYIHGLSVQVDINTKGIVTQVNGTDDLISTIAKRSNSSQKDAERLLSDYVSSAAITDLLNKIFSIPPDVTININDIWGREITLITKAPVKVDNLYTLNQRRGDTAYIGIKSVRFAQRSVGDTPYLKGNMNGNNTLSYSTGMPYDYETISETKTTTNYYIVTETEELKIKRLN